MKPLSTILISALIFSASAFGSIPKNPVAPLKEIIKYSAFKDKYESLWQVQDVDLPGRRIRLTEEDRLQITYPNATIPFPEVK